MLVKIGKKSSIGIKSDILTMFLGNPKGCLRKHITFRYPTKCKGGRIEGKEVRQASPDRAGRRVVVLSTLRKGENVRGKRLRGLRAGLRALLNSTRTVARRSGRAEDEEVWTKG